MAKCPFDGFKCGKQTKRKDDYKRWVHHLAVTGDTRVFYTRGDMFEDCKDKEKCEIKKEENHNEKENNVLLIGLIGISIVYVLNMIPVIGGYIAMISLMIGLGIVLKLFKK